MIALHRLRYLFLALALVLAATLIVRKIREAHRMARGGSVSEAARLPLDHAGNPTAEAVAAERGAIEKSIQRLTDYAPVVRLLEASFAADWDGALEAYGRRAAIARSRQGADAYIMETLRTVRRNRGVMAGKADPHALSTMFDAQMAIRGALADSNPHLCVNFLFGQSDRALLDFYAANRPLLAALVTSALSAIVDGTANPVDRPAPDDSDLQQLDDALVNRGLTRPEIDLLLDGRHPDPPIEDERLCQIGARLPALIGSLPDETRARVQAAAAAAMTRG